MRARLLWLALPLAVACGRAPVTTLGPDGSIGRSEGPILDAAPGTDADTRPDLGPGFDIGEPLDFGGIQDSQVPDAGPPDFGTGPDASFPDVSFPDSSLPDADIPDVNIPDVNIPDVNIPDVNIPDVNIPDVGGPDANIPDLGTPDSGAPDSGPVGECMSDQDCGFARPKCELQSQTCVACLQSSDCLPNFVCDTAGGYQCRPACINGSICLSGVCDSSIGACVECLGAGDCNADEVCDPSTKECVECIDNADCALNPGQNICDQDDGECVACIDDNDCPAGEVCDPGVDQCVPPIARALCDPCQGDAQCGGASDLCLGIGGVVDRACAIDCSNSPCPIGYGCLSVRQNSAQQCRPDYANGLQGWTPTCTAFRNLGSPCNFDPNDLDPGCGISGFRDARCVQSMSGGNAGFCTVFCVSQAECPTGFSCTGSPVNPGVCL